MIRLRGATTHNLRSVDIDLPVGELTVVTGVSGSGKSSLVFDTLHAEGRRRYLQALDVGGGALRRPPVQAIEGLPPTLALRQHERSPGSDQSLSDVSGVGEVLAVLMARLGVQHDPESGDPIVPLTHDQIARTLMTQPENTRLLVEAPLLPDSDADLPALLNEVRRAGFARIRMGGQVMRLDDLTANTPLNSDVRVVVDRLKLSQDSRSRLSEALRTAGQAGRGVIVAVLPDSEQVFVDRPFSLHSRRTFPPITPASFSRRGRGQCPGCGGSGITEEALCTDCSGVGLSEASRHIRLDGVRWSDVMQRSLTELSRWLGTLDFPDGVDVLAADLQHRLQTLTTLQLGGLTLGRPAKALSAGEWQRVRLAHLLGAPLAGVLYVLDEPTAGLADDVVDCVIEVIHTLVSGGNTVVAVSHREAVVRSAHQLIDMGPGAGELGGAVLFAGAAEEHRGATPTADWLAGRLQWPNPAPSTSSTAFRVAELCVRQIGPVDVELAHRGLTVVTGPSGSGRATIVQAVAQAIRDADSVQARVESPVDIERVLEVDRRRSGSNRSMVATFVGLWDVLRDLLAATTEARIRGLTAGTFSLNVKGGRCEACKGQGELRIDLGLLPPVFVPCEVCASQRFQEDVLGVRWKGLSAAGLLQLTASEAHAHLAGHPRLERILRGLMDVGLGYVRLGQSTLSLSGGEAARLRLAKELGRSVRGVSDAVIIMDAPTRALHPHDRIAMIRLLQRLSTESIGVLVSSVDPRVLAVASRVLSLG
ncbi:MAG: hypothetical protein AB8H79_00970 [Myxococcota bacterium]